MRHRLDQDLTAECLLQQAAALRSLGRELLDRTAADDLVQDTFVAAMEGRAPRGALGAWLHGIARRLALLARRREARLRAREQRSAPPLATGSAADAAVTAEWMQRITTAVQALPEAYRTPIVLRFWHELPPRAIAAQLGLPVNTVHSRLQRAFALLRQRLDERGSRAAWVGPLAAFVRAPMAAAGGFGALLLGVTCMATKTNLIVAAGLLAAGVWIVTADLSPPAAPSPPAGTGGSIGAAPRNDAGGHERHVAMAEPRTVVSGRCVAAEGGAPPGGCRVMLVEERAAGQREPPQVQQVFADVAGRFMFAAVPSARAHRLGAVAEHLVGVERAWTSLPPGSFDVGDVPMPAGARIAGTVCDTAGTGVGGVVFDVEPAVSPVVGAEAGFVPCKLPPVYSRADGVLVQEGCALAPGEWRIVMRTPEHLLRNPTHFVVAPGQRQVRLDIVVGLLADRPAIAGVVVDEAGAPVAGLTLRASDGSTGKSGGDGTFSIHRRSENEAPVRLAVPAQDTTTVCAPDAEYAWGSKDQRVVVRQAVGIWLQVARAETGEPVTDYGVWLMPLEDGEWPNGLRDAGRHEQGRLQLEHLRARRYRIVVCPGDSDLVPSEPLEVEVATNATFRVEVERARPLLVEVRTAAGEPVVGSTVDLFRHEREGELKPGTIGGAQLVYCRIKGGGGIVLSSVPTDAAGRALLAAPTRGRLGLRVRGAHVPHIEYPLRGESQSTALVITVERGAMLVGALTPASLLRELVPPLSGWRYDVVDGEFGDPDRPWPTILLRSTRNSRLVLPARIWMFHPGFPVRDDGTFHIEGIPAGDWQLELQFHVGDGAYSRVLGVAAGLGDGEQRDMKLDIGAFAPATLRATIRLDGELAANAEVRWGNGWFRTDARGEVVVRSPGRRDRIAVKPDGGAMAMVYSDQPFALDPGAVVEHTFELTRRRLRLLVLRADGTPAAGGVFSVSGLGGEFRAGADGRLLLDPAPPWEFTLHSSFEEAAWGRQELQELSGPLRMRLDRKEDVREVRLQR